MLSRWILRFAGISALCLAVCAAASAQYGGGGTGGTGGTGGYNPPSGGYGSGKAIGIGVGVAAAAAVGIVLLVRHHHHAAHKTQSYVTGCTQSLQDGISLTNKKDNQTYAIAAGSKSLKAGERMTLKGVVVAADGSGNPSFQIHSLIKDYGTCGSASASNGASPSSSSLN
ncbi:MAG: hypothetical protein ACYDCG_06820 [Candidatus Acidiferrales bacterium]